MYSGPSSPAESPFTSPRDASSGGKSWAPKKTTGEKKNGKKIRWLVVSIHSLSMLLLSKMVSSPFIWWTISVTGTIPPPCQCTSNSSWRLDTGNSRTCRDHDSCRPSCIRNLELGRCHENWRAGNVTCFYLAVKILRFPAIDAAGPYAKNKGAAHYVVKAAPGSTGHATWSVVNVHAFTRDTKIFATEPISSIFSMHILSHI